MNAPMLLSASVLSVPFRVDSIAEVGAPAGSEGLWHSYVITQGMNKITGIRSGTLMEVGQQLDAMIEQLNDRRLGKTKPRVKTVVRKQTAPSTPVTE